MAMPETSRLKQTEIRITIGVEFGIEFTTVTYLSISSYILEGLNLANGIRVIQNWPKTESQKVPSEISYSPSPRGCHQWGYDIDHNSRVQKFLRAGLDATNKLKELESFSEKVYDAASFDSKDFIAGDLPRHIAKTPDSIIEDFFELLIEKIHDNICNEIGRLAFDKVPTDLVFTYPAVSLLLCGGTILLV
ncbi:hypothetical protein B0T26DRAFT_705934 [Lasiosphaeria miniovina]|uniref:Uncharacterized protein n=1 Tax=Lasiosphaeria miniovina TaxID=1954250 RepID=A0AA40AWD3_9PEZI|nr:uncharacterized protein B0T26DRAFT_705934 [Lasiosphaeria miniovina]KAK0723266.1 hypothetical protein B0T26DRAFT_705934 [Lasiosphaeria miniovina]